VSTLDELAEALSRLAAVPSQIAADASERIGDLIQGEFDAGVDPYGHAWKPLAESTIERGRTPPPLTDTTDMRSGIEVRPMAGAGVSITFADPMPAAAHQTGWSGQQGDGPARPMLPDRGVPDTWEAALEQASAAATNRAVGRR
jgi:hypothetical protein